ncbi:hypothetical protein CEF09_19130, partial [Vibrio cholerae]
QLRSVEQEVQALSQEVKTATERAEMLRSAGEQMTQLETQLRSVEQEVQALSQEVKTATERAEMLRSAGEQ